MTYGITSKKIAHVIVDKPDNGHCGYWATACGRWIHPLEIVSDLSGQRLCSQCKKSLEAKQNER